MRTSIHDSVAHHAAILLAIRHVEDLHPWLKARGSIAPEFVGMDHVPIGTGSDSADPR